MRQSLVALVIGAFYFLTPFTDLLPGFILISGKIFWIISLVLTGGVIIYSGRDFYLGAYRAFLNHTANMDTLVAMGTGAAWIYSAAVILFHQHIPASAEGIYFDTACLVIGFVVLGAAMEMKARSQTSAAITDLLSLSPSTATVVKEGNEQEVPIAEIQVGDMLRLKPGDKVAVDGRVFSGDTYIDESMLTGEPMPVKKVGGADLYAGTVNQLGSVLFQASRVGSDTALSHIIETVKKAQHSKPSIARLVDKISSIFSPLVMIIALLTGFVWLNWGPPPVAVHVLVTMMAVLLIACPCALGLATPISIMIAVGRAARMGLIVRQGEALQQAGRLTAVVLDKTGTITVGKPTVTEVVVVEGMKEHRLLQIASAIEQSSEHPLARAICEKARSESLSFVSASDFSAIAGHGVSARVEGEIYFLGNSRLMQREHLDLSPLQEALKRCTQSAKTPIFIATETKVLGLIAVTDPIKKEAIGAIAALKAKGLRIALLTGDHAGTAQQVANQVGISPERVYSEVLPQDKDRVIAQLIEEGEVVAMVGDGINDAAALSRAHLGFAMGAGTDIAIESADMVLMNDSLWGVVRAIELSQLTMRNIKQNLVGAFIYNVLGIPIAAGILYPWLGILLSPILSGIAMAASSLTVVTNANRLRWIKTAHQQGRGKA